VAHLSYQVQRVVNGAWTVWQGARVARLSATSSFGGDSTSPIAWGSVPPPTAEIAVWGVSPDLPEVWGDIPVRLLLGRGTAPVSVFEGLISKRGRVTSNTQHEVRFTAIGYGELVRRTRPTSPLYYRRVAATRTEATSQDDPRAPGYAAGLINYALWAAGGAPLEQASTPAFAQARFWYSCDEALIAPEWAWLNGEDAYAEIGELARSVGGVVMQTPDGVVRFVSPLSPTLGPPAATLIEGRLRQQGLLAVPDLVNPLYYAEASDDGVVTSAIDRVRVPWVFRARQALQDVWALPSRRRVPARGEAPEYAQYGTIPIEFQTDYPIYRWQNVGVGDALTLTEATVEDMGLSDMSGWPITPKRNGAEGNATFFIATRMDAQRVEGEFRHNYPQPVMLNKLIIRGEPVVVVHEGEAVAGRATGGTELSYPSNLYISSEAHAQMLAAMLLAFHRVARPVYSFRGVQFSPRLFGGARIRVYNAKLGLADTLMLITTCTVNATTDGGITMDLDAIPIGDLPQIESCYLWGEAIGPTPKAVLW
jgi:hypothetical protein